MCSLTNVPCKRVQTRKLRSAFTSSLFFYFRWLKINQSACNGLKTYNSLCNTENEPQLYDNQKRMSLHQWLCILFCSAHYCVNGRHTGDRGGLQCHTYKVLFTQHFCNRNTLIKLMRAVHPFCLWSQFTTCYRSNKIFESCSLSSTSTLTSISSEITTPSKADLEVQSSLGKLLMNYIILIFSVIEIEHLLCFAYFNQQNWSGNRKL